MHGNNEFDLCTSGGINEIESFDSGVDLPFLYFRFMQCLLYVGVVPSWPVAFSS